MRDVDIPGTPAVTLVILVMVCLLHFKAFSMIAYNATECKNSPYIRRSKNR